MEVTNFQETIWQKAHELYRDMPWRDNTAPYYVLVSELMLQQTQVDRVIPKFTAFMLLFPTIQALAGASLSDVLVAWSGLGYNRRAKFLYDAARKVVAEYKGTIPDTYDALITLPGIGPNTAGAILAYSFNRPIIFIETNVRTVYFYHFFEDQPLVSDKELRQVVEGTIDREHPRQWYWALMDYGSYLKKQGAGRIDKSSHYKKQPPLKGSVREVRGMIVKALAMKDLHVEDLRAEIRIPTADKRFDTSMAALIDEGIIKQTGNRLYLMK